MTTGSTGAFGVADAVRIAREAHEGQLTPRGSAEPVATAAVPESWDAFTKGLTAVLSELEADAYVILESMASGRSVQLAVQDFALPVESIAAHLVVVITVWPRPTHDPEWPTGLPTAESRCPNMNLTAQGACDVKHRYPPDTVAPVAG